MPVRRGNFNPRAITKVTVITAPAPLSAVPPSFPIPGGLITFAATGVWTSGVSSVGRFLRAAEKPLRFPADFHETDRQHVSALGWG